MKYTNNQNYKFNIIFLLNSKICLLNHILLVSQNFQFTSIKIPSLSLIEQYYLRSMA